MVSNKKRLYVALYPSGVVNDEERRYKDGKVLSFRIISRLWLLIPDRYHCGFLIGPKVENKLQIPGVRYHVRNLPIQGWVYEEVPLPNVRNTNSLFARIAIAKVEDEKRLVKILRTRLSFRTTPIGDAAHGCRMRWLD